MRFSLPSIKCLAAPPSFRAVIKSLSTVQRTKQCLAVVRSLEEPPNIWLTVAKNVFVGWALNFRVRSFGVIRIRTSHPRSVWIMVHQRNRWIHSGYGFTGFFDAPWSREILDHWSWSRSPQRNAALESALYWKGAVMQITIAVTKKVSRFTLQHACK